MKSVKKILGAFGIIICALFLIPNNVHASEKTDEILKKISPDGKTATFKMIKPTTKEQSEFLFSGLIGRNFAEDGYYIYVDCQEPDFTTCDVIIQSDDLETGWDSELNQEIILKGEKVKSTLTAIYNQPTDTKIINSYISKLREANDSDPTTWYEIEDLSLINYYMTSSKSELWNREAPGRALKYVKELNEITEGTDVSFYLEAWKGSQDESLMYESAFGPMTIFYGDYAYSTKEEGIYLKRVIYIPESTIDTKEAYIEAAQKRINDYLGNDSVKVTYGGLLSSLEEESEDIDNPIVSDGNYYNIKILDRTYKFYIVKGSSDKLIEPKYNGKNLETNISISSDNANVPLDTNIKV